MEQTWIQVLLNHWHIALAVWFLSSAIGAMPTPNGGAVTGSWWYRWLFGTLHTAVGNIPRVLATMFPKIVEKLAKTFLGITVPDESRPQTEPKP